MQTSTTPTTALSTATKIWVKEGPLAFYKGTLTPLIGIGACVSVQFGAFHEARRRLAGWNKEYRPQRKELTLGQYYLAGATAGVANTVLSSPIEHVRIRLQTQPHGAHRLYDGPASCIRTLLRTSGLFHGLYAGSVVTLLREAQAYGVWFLTFEYLMSRELRRPNVRREDIPSWKVALYGGLAGEALWLASYPFDVVKSRMQTDEVDRSNRKYKNMRDAFKKTWAEQGARGFWKGIGPTMVRAMPVSAGTFFVVEMVMRVLG
ncbi:mitochondrial carrier domain-containing protein [Kalaharituber pfeilii]|nr:mitochondrial carrier domain-containing protein [Kalaharituber pfeilii]